MPLGSAAKSTIDIDFTRAQGVNSSGQISFEPPRIRVGTTMVSPYKVLVPVVNGIATVDLVRLPTGTYHVRENIDGRAPYEFNFALPLAAAATIQYEDIAPVDPVPLVYTVVRTVNGLPPDPTTGNINIASGGDPVGLNDLTDVTIASLINGQSIVYDAVSSQWRNLALTAGDVGASPTGHTHPSEAIDISDVAGLQTALDGKAASAHTHTVVQITDFVTASEEIAELAAEAATADLALPNRILRIKDRTKQGSGDTYNLPNTASAWSLWAVGPMEYTIEASVGDDISLDYDFMMQIHVSCFFDFVVVTGGTPTVQRYLASGDATPTFNGPSGSYPSNDQFQGIKGTLGFQAQSGDIEGGIIRLRWAIKTSVDTGKIYANNNYPLSVTVANTRLSGL